MLWVTVDSRGRLRGDGELRVCVCVTSLALHQPQGLKNSNVKPFWRNTWKHPIETGRDASLCLGKWIRGSPNVKHHPWKRSLQFLRGIKGSFTLALSEFSQVEKVKTWTLIMPFCHIDPTFTGPRWCSQTSFCADKPTDGVFDYIGAELWALGGCMGVSYSVQLIFTVATSVGFFLNKRNYTALFTRGQWNTENIAVLFYWKFCGLFFQANENRNTFKML